MGRYGDGPWRRLAEVNDFAHEPQAAGIPGVVRVTYVSQHESIEARSLGPHAKQNAIRFDPVSGARTPIGTIQADAQGCWKCAAPSDHDHDWVVILEAAAPDDSNIDRRSPK